MNLDRRIKVQLAVFTVIALVAAAVMIFRYINVPAMLFGVGHYNVTVELTRAGGLYPNANVTYQGTEVGRVESVELTDTGVQAVLSLKSAFEIPSQLRADVHSQSAIGEQYVDLQPRTADARPLKNGDVIPADETSVRPDIDSLLDATNRGLTAIPQRQPQDGNRRKLHRHWRIGSRTDPASQGIHRPGHRCRQEPRPTHRPDRASHSRSWIPKPTAPTRSTPGRDIWPPSPRQLAATR